MNRTENVSHSPDRFARPEVIAGVFAAVILVGMYFVTVAIMRTILALGWYVA